MNSERGNVVTTSDRTGLDGLKWAIKLFVPPIVLGVVRFVLRLGRPVKEQGDASDRPCLEYAPAGWDTKLFDTMTGWNSPTVIAEEEAKWKAFCRNAAGSGPLGFSHEATDLSFLRDVRQHNVHISFAYVLALAAHRRDSLSVLDWGGALGHYYVIARAVLPDVHFEYHCKEMPLLVEAGKRLNPEVVWHADDSALDRTYDLVIIDGSLQCMRDWREFLARAVMAVAPGGYLLLTRVPMVEGAPFVAIQRVYCAVMFHQQFNRKELLGMVENSGLRMVREIVVGDRPCIVNAPEQCELRGWLFRKDAV